MVYVCEMEHRGLALSIAIAVVALVGCSSDAPEPPVVVGTVAQPAVTTTVAPARPSTIEPDTAEALEVGITLVVESEGIDTELRAVLDPAAIEQSDPFGSFAACSGAQRSFGPYSVLVSSGLGDVAVARILTTGTVSGPGIYDADVRIELRSGDSRSAIGTVTIGADLRSGDFTAFGPDGELLNGSFECRGGESSAAPLTTTDAVGVLDAIEVAVLLRRAGAERVLGVAVDTTRSPDVAAQCPAAVGESGPIVVRVDGGTGIGAITTFELTGGDAPTIRLRAGGVSYTFEQVTLTLADPPTTGTFSATADGVSVDGAFHCT